MSEKASAAIVVTLQTDSGADQKKRLLWLAARCSLHGLQRERLPRWPCNVRQRRRLSPSLFPLALREVTMSIPQRLLLAFARCQDFAWLPG